MSIFRIRKPIQNVWYITVKHMSLAKWYKGGRHHGIDLRTRCKEFPNGIGTPIYAVANGIWERSYYNRMMGNTVILRHGRYQTVYGHLSKDNFIEGYTKVKAGDIIGYSGDTGRMCFGSHLHFEVRKNGKSLDPEKFIEAGKNLVKKIRTKPVLLRTEKNGEIQYYVKGGFVKLNKDNCWSIISKNAYGINEEDYQDLLNLL